MGITDSHACPSLISKSFKKKPGFGCALLFGVSPTPAALFAVRSRALPAFPPSVPSYRSDAPPPPECSLLQALAYSAIVTPDYPAENSESYLANPPGNLYSIYNVFCTDFICHNHMCYFFRK